MNKKPKIAIVTWYNCLRNIKSSIGAWLLGYELELITKKDGYALAAELQFDHIYDHVRIYETNSQLEAMLKRSKADVFWCHNEPDLMAAIAAMPHIKKDRIVIHDCHDLPTFHTGHENDLGMLELEKMACEKSDYVFVPTPDYIDVISKRYNRKPEHIIQVNSCAPSIFFPDYKLPYVTGMLYCGQVNVAGMNSQLRFRDVLPLFQFLTSQAVPTHIYNTNPAADLTPYIASGASCHGTLKMFSAMHQYTRYDYAFVGTNIDCREIQCCMPNKLWDSMAAGLPLISLNARTAGKFITDHNIGLDIQGLTNMAEVPWIRNDNGKLTNFDFWQEKKMNVLKIAREYTAEKEVRRAFDIIGI